MFIMKKDHERFFLHKMGNLFKSAPIIPSTIRNSWNTLHRSVCSTFVLKRLSTEENVNRYGKFSLGTL